MAVEMAFSDFDDMATGPQGKRMHSHDRTLLANLSFADPDKKNPEHDAICRYLIQPETFNRVFAAVASSYPDGCKNFRGYITHKGKDYFCDVETGRDLGFTGSGVTEYHLVKGSGTYQSTVGFIDVVFTIKRSHEYKIVSELLSTEVKKWVDGKDQITPEKWAAVDPPVPNVIKDYRDTNLIGEVKIERVSAGDILRQIELYKSYFFTRDEIEIKKLFAIVVAPWSPTESELNDLKNHGIMMMTLGDHYKQWREADLKTTPVVATI